MLSKLLTTVIIWIMATAKSQDKRQEKMMFTVLPIIAICDSIAFSIINAFLI